MKVSKFSIGIFLLIFLLTGCKNKSLELALDKAGQNRAELDKVLEHYKNTGEKEKYKAAVFLISNMQNKYGRYGDFVKNYYPVFDVLKDLHSQKASRDTINKYIKLRWDSIENKVGPITAENTPYYYDLNVINAEYLIENIDYSFKAWKEKPWAKHLNFDQFCELILPYRVFDEPLQFYRKQFYEKFSWLEDSVKDKGNPLEACLKLNKYFADSFAFCSKLDKCPILGINDMLSASGGICEHRYYLMIMAMRAVGIPVGLENTPQLNDGPSAHFWMSVIDKNGKFRSFNGGEPDVKFGDTILCSIGAGYTTKVYRYLYADQKHEIINRKAPKDIAPYFRNANIQDVMEEYDIPQKTIKISLEDTRGKDYLYLCCFGMSYNVFPVAVSEIFWKKAKFKNTGLNCVYFPAFFKDNEIVIAGEPVHYLASGEQQPLVPDYSKTRKIKLVRKFIPQQYIYSMYDFAKYAKGAKFQASDDPDFKNPVNIYEVDTSYFHFLEKEVTISKPYRYYRYLSTNTGPIRLAEIDFMISGNEYGLDRTKQYKIFGYALKDSGITELDFKKAFDANVASNLNAPAGSWVAIDFGKEVKISKVRFLIRNDLNVIEIGDNYQLLCFDKGWKVLGEKVADKNYIEFDNVPENALLLLRDLTKGREERIFVYKDGKQIFL